MRKIALAFFIVIMAAAAAAAAVQRNDEEEYRNLNELRVKLGRMKREMDGFMKDLMATTPGLEEGAAGNYGQDVRVDVTEDDKEVKVKADLPGMDKDKIEITLENYKFLRIRGSREIYKEEKSAGVVRRERMAGRFERVLELPAECKSEGIRATYTNGVLEVAIPKKEKAAKEAVKISVQ